MHLRPASTCVFPHMESIFDGYQHVPFMMLFCAPLLKTCIIAHLLLQYYVGSAKYRRCCGWLENNVNKCIILLWICPRMCESMRFSRIHAPQKPSKLASFSCVLLNKTKSNVFTMNSNCLIPPTGNGVSFSEWYVLSELQLLPSFSNEILSSSTVEATTLIISLDGLGYIASRNV